MLNPMNLSLEEPEEKIKPVSPTKRKASSSEMTMLGDTDRVKSFDLGSSFDAKTEL